MASQTSKLQRILIVEDEDNARKGYEALLRKWNWDILGVGSGEEALAKFQDYQPDLILADVELPGMNGLDLLAHLGEEILPDELEENLVRHLRRWAPYVGRFGLLALELHTIPPELAAANAKKTPAVAYDGTHGFSDQYLIEVEVFLDCAREAGLHADPRFQSRFPPSELATVSINFFTAPQA